MKNIINIKDISYKKNDLLILDSINLKIRKREFISILGTSGSGKTSLINIISGRLKPLNGSIVLDKNISTMMVVTDNYNDIFVTNKVYDELAYPLRKAKISEEEIKVRINRIVVALNIKNILDCMPNCLSNGEKSLVSFGSKIIAYPDVLIIDEAFIMIDSVTKEKIFSLIKKICDEENMTVIYITKNTDDILYTDRVVLLSDGKIYLDSNIKDAFNDEKIYREAGISLPFMVDLSKKLQYYDLVDKIYFSMNKLVNKLWK